MSLQTDFRSSSSPWGIASGAEYSGKLPEIMPLLRDAGITGLRYFPEWQSIQPAPDLWDWEWSDRLVASAKANGIRIAGVFLYFAPWASSDGGTRGFPLKSMESWREFVLTTVSRYRDEIDCWEVWNEVNSPAFNHQGTPRDYADMVRVAYSAAKEANPACKIAISCAAYDLHYFDQTIKAGASGCFDYVCVHPYNSIGYVFGSEPSYLAMAGNIRAMLAANGQNADMPLWISEIGLTTTPAPEQLARQAEALVRSFVLNLVQGFERTYWFEATGPKYGEGIHAILSEDLSALPAYTALAAMTRVLGPTPRYLGWTALKGRCYGFVFKNGTESVMVLWAASAGANTSFEEPVTVVDCRRRVSTLPARQTLILADETVFIRGVSSRTEEEAQANVNRRFPWAPDYGSASEVWCQLGPVNVEHGLRQGNNDPRTDGITILGTCDGTSYRSTDLLNRRPFIYFDVDSTFAGWNDRSFEITVTARRADPRKPAAMTLVYESMTGYHEYGKRTTTPGLNVEMMFESESYRFPELWYLPSDEAWHTHTWKIDDACFIQKWGWTFELNVEMSSSDVWVQEVRVKKI